MAKKKNRKAKTKVKSLNKVQETTKVKQPSESNKAQETTKVKQPVESDKAKETTKVKQPSESNKANEQHISSHNKVKNLRNSYNKLNLKTKFILTGLISALGATATTSVVCTNYYNKKYSIETQESSSYEENSLSSLGKALEEKNILSIKPIYTIDPMYDYRFENIKDYIINSHIITSSSTQKLQEVYIIETSDTEIVYAELEKCKASMEENKNDDTEKALSKAILNKKGNYVYLIVSDNAPKIEKYILKHLD